jgi:hypothetical protein
MEVSGQLHATIHGTPFGGFSIVSAAYVKISTIYVQFPSFELQAGESVFATSCLKIKTILLW